MDIVSNQAKSYHTKPTVNLLYNSQNKSDFDEIFTVASNGCCLKPNHTQQVRASAITFEFGRHNDTYSKVPQHPKIPNLFLVKIKK